MMNSGLPDSLVFQTHNHQTSRMGIRDNSGKGEMEQMRDFLKNFSDSDKREVAKRGSEWEEEQLLLEKLMDEGSKKTR